MILHLIFAGIFGAISGSFLNVLILRFGKRSILGRSLCSSCARKLTWYELIPIFSFFALGGHCRTCRSLISIQYPIVESLTAFVFVLIGIVTYPNLLSFLFFAGVFSILIAIAVYDLFHKVVPDPFVFTFIVLTLLFALFSFFVYEIHIGFYLNLLAGPILFLPFLMLWYFSKGRLMGLGDGKLALGIGWLLGLPLGLSAITLGFWSGALISLLLLFFFRLSNTSKRLTMKSEVPFAPFLIAATFLVFITNLNIFSWSAGF